MVDKFLPKSVQTEIGKGDQFWLPKLVRLDRFWQQKWSGGPLLAGFWAKSVRPDRFLGGNDFGVTGKTSGAKRHFCRVPTILRNGTERNACLAKCLFYGTSAWMAQQHFPTIFHLSETICMTYLMQWLVNWRICMAIHGV